MFIKLKQKKYHTKILSKKISGFGIFKFPSRKVLLGVFLMVMIFGGIFGGVDNAKAYSEGDCWPTFDECDKERIIYNRNLGPNDRVLGCKPEGDQYCLKIASAADIFTKKNVTGTIVNPVKKWAIDAIGIVLNYLGNIVVAIIYFVCWVLLLVVGLFVNLAAFFLNATLNPDLYVDMFGPDSTIVNEGWRIIRDICNMFFILILLVISLATILRIQTYKAQSLLLPLLIAAFLVNFSRPIVEVAIDASQLLMYQFVNMIGTVGGNTSDIGGLVAAKDAIIKQFSGWDLFGEILGGDFMTDALNWVIGIIFALVFLIALCFVYLAMALFMIIRLVALTILIILSPIGFFFNILPQTKSYASKYWSELSKYLIFGPVMAFFIYLASFLAVDVSDLRIELESVSATGTVGAFSGILQYIIVLVFLYASIWIARQLGIAGADKVAGMTTGKAVAFAGMAGGAIGGAVGGYLGGAAGRAGSWTAKKADSVSGGRLGRAKEKLKKIPGGSGIIAAESKIKAKQRKKAEEYESTLSSQSSDVVRARGNSITANPEESAAAIKILAARDDLDKVKDKKLFEKAKRGGVDTDAIHNRMPSWAGNKQDKAGNKQDKEREVKRIAEEGKVGQISSKSLKDEDIMDALRGQLSSDEMKRIYRVWGREQQDAAEKGLKKAMQEETTPFSDDDIKRRNLFAGLSGKTKEAFEIKPGVTTTVGGNEAKKYVLKMTPRDIEKVDEKDNLEVIGAYITKAQLTSVRGELSGDQKKVIKDFIITTRNATTSPTYGPDEVDYVKTSPNWAV